MHSAKGTSVAAIKYSLYKKIKKSAAIMPMEKSLLAKRDVLESSCFGWYNVNGYAPAEQ